MGKKFARFVAAFVAFAVAISVVVPAAVSFAASTSEEENAKYSLQGLLEWLQKDETVEELGLTTEQENDIANAASMLETYSTTYYNEALCIDVTDEDDAANLDNVLYALEVLEDIEELRNDDPYYNQLYSMTDLYTNFSMMVGSAYTANVSIYEVAHVSTFSTFSNNEGLAWGTKTPDDAWYSEIEYIDAAMEQLSYSVEDLTTELWSEVTSLASTLATDANDSIGHYTGLFYGVSSGSDTLMGVGYTTESYRYSRTASYNATKATTYTNKNMAVYTISDFEKIVNTYICEEINEGHTYTSEVTIAATCESAGTTTYTCSVCGDVYTETIAALGHDYDLTNVTWEWASDLSTATATVACKNDASHVLTATATATSEVTTAATCTTEGVETYTATVSFDGYDGEYSTTTTAAVAVDEDAHTWGEGVVTEPTCTEDGYTTYMCTECGETKTEAGDAAIGHSWQISWGDWYEGDDGWTCTATLVCENDSSHVLSGTVSVKSETSEDATCYSEGATVYTATATFDGVDATYTNDVTKTAYTGTASHTLTKVDEVAATCTEEGTEAYWVCSVCNRMFSDDAGETEIFATVAIEATGHSYTNYVSNDDATCTADGTKTAECDNGCGETDTVADEGSALGHSWGEGVVTATAFGDDTGEITYTCTDCGETYTVSFTYEVTEGAGQSVARGSSLGATANGELGKFVSLEIDGTALDEGDYTAVSGSTVVTVSADYLDELELGEHTLRFVYEDGDASTTFTIVEDAAEDETSADTETNADVDADSGSDSDADAETDTDAGDATTDTETGTGTDDTAAATETDANEDADEDDEETIPATGDQQALYVAAVAAAGAVLVAAGMVDRRRRQR